MIRDAREMIPPPPRATLAEFAVVNDAAAATAAKLQKQKILADYLRTLDDEDLTLAVRYAAGRAFPSVDERVLGASGAIVSDVILSIYPIDGGAFHALVVRSGEIGEALSALITERNSEPTSDPHRLAGGHAHRSSDDAAREVDPKSDNATSPLTLHEISLAFDELAATGNQSRKRDILQALFRRAAGPREAAYLAKVIFSDLRTGVKEGVLQAAVALAFGKTLAEIQRTQLLMGDLSNVALLAKRDDLASARFELFHPIQFMLATPQDTTEIAVSTMDGRTFFAEDKLDGIRAQVHKSGLGRSARVQIYTRTMDRTDESFPDVVAAVRDLPGDFLLDGEIVPYRNGTVLPFAHIQRRLGRKSVAAKSLKDNPAAFIAFDLLYLDGALLMDQPLKVRREKLAALASSTTPSKLLTTAVTEVKSAEEIDRAFCTARDCRNEGLVLKDPESIYAPGRRGQAWLKLKTHLPTIDCVVTAAEYGHGKRRNSLSDYTFAVWDREPTEPDAKLVNVGKAFSGVTDEEIKTLTTLFLGLATAQRGRVYLVRPQVVLEIACDQIQKSGRHASGFALRFPRIKRIRWDKTPADADRLARVAELFQSIDNMAHAQVAPTEQRAESVEPTLFDGL